MTAVVGLIVFLMLLVWLGSRNKYRANPANEMTHRRDGVDINPANGLLMFDKMIDIAGNQRGTDSHNG